jgi:hypothetical protein
MLDLRPLLSCGTSTDAPQRSRERKALNATHRQTMMGATIVHGGEDEWSRDEDVEMEDVL